ncbi:TIGR01457 family HAD-type hydrolase [Paenibacillus sp. 481]|uniref:TIGR01457 family HAD-type hydrolase n=1 Tax=Paenibacillus sp. 481 TaxID=2835869 RepID=UPI001E32041F|nr:TIGR01457 family HAD-type hydrolase [Paenibacillus sp. 481]UHA73095.1 TIGR01457 family HAD-type hydrolase [Paenibacillus sp. 481]
MNKETQQRLRAFIDLDGTLYHGSTMIEGANELIATLNQLNVPYLFVTNNSSRTPEAVAKFLNSIGIDARDDHVLTSAQAAASYIQKHYTKQKVFVIGEEGLQQALSDSGANWTDCVEEAWTTDIGVVVQGIDRQLSYAKLEAASAAILRGAAFVLTNPDLMLPSDKGISPGAGTIGAALQAATGVDPVVIGKPSHIIMNAALERLGCSAEEAIVIGDNMLTDMKAGAQVGCRTALVYTGVTTPNNFASYKEKSGVIPDLVFHNLQEIRQWIIEEVSATI